MEKQIVFLNGQFVEKENASLSIFDHGFLYGDGVFEGVRVYDSNIYKLEEHIKRLYESAHSIMLEIPYTKEALIGLVVETVQKNNLSSAYIRIVASRGPGDLGLDPRNCHDATVLVIAEPLAIYPEALYENGLRLASVVNRRSSADVLNPQIKTLNYLNNIMVKMASVQSNSDEALILNREGYVTEGSSDNVFIVKDGILKTPPIYLGVLEGITRNAIMDIAREEGYQVEETAFTLHDVYVADEVFLTGTAAEVIPAISADNRLIGDGSPGVITKHLLKKFRERTVVDGVSCHDKVK